MSQLKLISSEESAEDLCELIKAYHAELLEMRAEMQRSFSVLLAVKGESSAVVQPQVEVTLVDEPAPVVELAPVVKPTARTWTRLPEHIAVIGREARQLRNESEVLSAEASKAAPKDRPELLRQAAAKLDASRQKLSEYDKVREEYRPRTDNRKNHQTIK